MAQPVIALYTDFGTRDPYVGQMHAAIAARAPGTAVIDLHHYAPAFEPGPAGLLLEALVPFLPPRAVVVGVVDPGVGTERGTLAVGTRDQWLVGPDNGLFTPLLDGLGTECHRLRVSGDRLPSASFHGRDLFAPAAAELVRGDRMVLGEAVPEPVRAPAGRERILYVDHYGNLITGLRAPAGEAGRLRVAGQELGFARTFAEADRGTLFWYRNSLDLVEVAAREASAASLLGAGPGTPVTWTGGD